MIGQESLAEREKPSLSTQRLQLDWNPQKHNRKYTPVNISQELITQELNASHKS
jgi:hypothetical protein